MIGLLFLGLFVLVGGWAYMARSLIRNDNFHPLPSRIELEKSAIIRAVLLVGERIEEMRAGLARLAQAGVKAEEAIAGFQRAWRASYRPKGVNDVDR